MSEVIAHQRVVEAITKKTTSKGTITSTVESVQSVKAKKQAKKILAGINEAEQIHAGKKQGQSFDDFLTEL